ncbi:MAG: type II toxin-antitoxin system RatA family toxin [Gammaproteobacteria bacterium]
MTAIRRSAFVPFLPEQMYALVNDVSAYPEFLPWCVAADVLHVDERSMRARLAVKRGRFDYAFTTANRLVAPRTIELRLVEGPFRKFVGAWHFSAVENGCLVRLNLDFEFSSRLLGVALTAAFRPIADSLVEAFRKRAHVVYDD